MRGAGQGDDQLVDVVRAGEPGQVRAVAEDRHAGDVVARVERRAVGGRPVGHEADHLVAEPGGAANSVEDELAGLARPDDEQAVARGGAAAHQPDQLAVHEAPGGDQADAEHPADDEHLARRRDELLAQQQRVERQREDQADRDGGADPVELVDLRDAALEVVEPGEGERGEQRDHHHRQHGAVGLPRRLDEGAEEVDAGAQPVGRVEGGDDHQRVDRRARADDQHLEPALHRRPAPQPPPVGRRRALGPPEDRRGRRGGQRRLHHARFRTSVADSRRAAGTLQLPALPPAPPAGSRQQAPAPRSPPAGGTPVRAIRLPACARPGAAGWRRRPARRVPRCQAPPAS